MSVSFWSLVDSCLISNHTSSSFLYIMKYGRWVWSTQDSTEVSKNTNTVLASGEETVILPEHRYFDGV